jgi:hypothetical protein
VNQGGALVSAGAIGVTARGDAALVDRSGHGNLGVLVGGGLCAAERNVGR